MDETPDDAPVPPRRPRIALMGEFSAGKSTLINIMVGRPVIPTRVTATQLPPVWLAHGDAAPWREDPQGNRHPVDPARLEDVPLADTAFIRLFLEAEVLEVCDLIDTPGISDPDMPPELWERAADQADAVLWLTHATQAWRQSEAAVWETMPPELYAQSLLIVTRMDKLTSERDRQRVLARVRAETEGLFADVLPMSLTGALAAGDDADRWAAAGGAAFSDALLEIIEGVARRLRLSGGQRPSRRGAAPAALPRQDPASVVAARRHLRVVPDAAADPGDGAPALPRRVAPGDGPRPARPPRPE